MSDDDPVARWIAALEPRYRAQFEPREFLRAVRALSSRYVEHRHQLHDRSPLDSDGKRAAFAAFYAPLHYFAIDALVRAAGATSRPVETILDLGCGTGVASAAWALALPRPAPILGVDALGWPLAEAAWTWRTLGVTGRASRGDLVAFVRRRLRSRDAATTAVVAAWSVNELSDEARKLLLDALLEAGARGTTVLIVEPIGSQATPWWPSWRDAVSRAGGSANEWRLDLALPESLRTLQEAAGFPAAPAALKSLLLAPALERRTV